MITIKMWGGKWRIIIGDEIWEFDNNEDFGTTLSYLLGMKDDFGRIGGKHVL